MDILPINLYIQYYREQRLFHTFGLCGTMQHPVYNLGRLLKVCYINKVSMLPYFLLYDFVFQVQGNIIRFLSPIDEELEYQIYGAYADKMFHFYKSKLVDIYIDYTGEVTTNLKFRCNTHQDYYGVIGDSNDIEFMEMEKINEWLG